MKKHNAAHDGAMRPAIESIRVGESGIEVPKEHIGPVLLSGTGRSVWWTGRVAIGLRYQAPRYAEAYGQSALLMQEVLLRSAKQSP